MEKKLTSAYLAAKFWLQRQVDHLLHEEKGGSEIVVVILIIIVMIALVAIFSDTIKELVTGWLEKMKEGGDAVVDGAAELTTK